MPLSRREIGITIRPLGRRTGTRRSSPTRHGTGTRAADRYGPTDRPTGEEVSRLGPARAHLARASRRRSLAPTGSRPHTAARFTTSPRGVRALLPGCAGALRMDATRGPILFRCDGTPELGWEPFYQCLSLAAALQRRRRGTHFLSYLDPLSLATVINRGNNDWAAGRAAARLTRRPGGHARAGPAAQRRGGRRRGGGNDRRLPRELKETGALVVVFDSTAEMHFPRDLVVNPLLAPGKKAYRVEPGCQLLLGHRFALCRGRVPPAADDPRDRAADAVPRPRRDGRRRLGGRRRHPHASSCSRWRRSSKVSVAVRTHHPQYDDLLELADGVGRDGRGRHRDEGTDDAARSRSLRA